MTQMASQRPHPIGAAAPWLLMMMLIAAAPVCIGNAAEPSLLTAEEKAYLARKGEVAYCIDPDRLPFSAIREGRPQGMAVEILGRIEKQIGVPFRFVSTDTWRMSLEYAAAGRCDILPAIDVSPPRPPFLSFTLPYFRYGVAIVTQTHAPFVSGVRDMRNRTVGLGESAILWEPMAEKYPFIPLVEVDSPRKGLEKVSCGDLDALVVSMPAAVYHIRRLGLTGLKVAGHADILRETGIGVREELPMLRTILNKAVTVMSEGEVDRIYRRHIAIRPEDRVDYGPLAWGFLGIVLIVGCLLAWNRKVTRLKKRIAKIQAELAAKDEQMKMMAITDPLTNLYNRMRLIDVLAKEMQRFHRYRRPVSVILADVDNFKEINKEFGYNLGDVVLCKIGQALAANVRKADICGRWGGEKFMIVCPETESEGTRTLAEHLREIVESIQLPKAGYRTCSFGVAAFAAGDNKETIVHRADKAQNLAKEKGGNRVEVAG